MQYMYVPVKELHIYVRENLMEEFSCDHRWDLEIIKTKVKKQEKKNKLKIFQSAFSYMVLCH